jgi:hypothetical protein
MSHKKLIWVLSLFCLLQQQDVRAAASTPQPGPLDCFFIRVYVDKAEYVYIAVGKQEAGDPAALVSSQKFMQHVGPVLTQFINLCGENLRSIVTTDFDTLYPLVPLVLTDLEAVERWMYHSKIGATLHLLRRNYYGPKLLGKAIELVRTAPSIPKNNVELLFEVVCYDGKVVGIIKDNEFVSPEKLPETVQTVLLKSGARAGRSSASPVMSYQKKPQQTKAEKFLYRHYGTMASGLCFTGEVFAYADGYGFGALMKSLCKKTASAAVGKVVTDVAIPHARRAFAAYKKEFEKKTEPPVQVPSSECVEQGLQVPSQDMLDILMGAP